MPKAFHEYEPPKSSRGQGRSGPKYTRSTSATADTAVVLMFQSAPTRTVPSRIEEPRARASRPNNPRPARPAVDADHDAGPVRNGFCGRQRVRRARAHQEGELRPEGGLAHSHGHRSS